MGDTLFNKNEHMERVEKFQSIIDKIISKRDITENQLFTEIKANIFYMQKFLKGDIPNFPHVKILERIAYISEGIVTYEELKQICGINKLRYLKSNPQNIRRGDIYWVKLPDAVGSEQGGTRPCMIVQNNAGNKFSPTVIVVPITTSMSKGKLPTHIEIGQSCGLERNSIVLMEQIKTIDKQRVGDYISSIYGKNTIKKIDKAFKISGGCWSEYDQIIENMEQVDERGMSDLSKFKQKFNELLRKLRNRDVVY